MTSVISRIARTVTWTIFLVVITVSAGLSLDPDWQSNIPGMFQAAFLFSGVAVVAVAEYHIQRFEIKQSGGAVRLAFILAALAFFYYVASVFAAHSDVLEGWLVLLVWMIVFVGPAVRSKPELKMLGRSAAWLAIAALLVLLVSNWLWPTFYYGYLFKDKGQLALTPYFMFAIGPVMWVALLLLAMRLRNVAQQGAPGDRPRPAGSAGA